MKEWSVISAGLAEGPRYRRYGVTSIIEHHGALGQNALCDKALLYWESKRNGGKLPARSDLNPREIVPFISHVALLDVARPGPIYGDFTLRVRLAGTAITPTFGAITGRDVMEITNRPAAKSLYNAAGQALSQKQGVLCVLSGLSEEQSYKTVYWMFLPLRTPSDAGESIGQIFCCVDVRCRDDLDG